MRGIKKFSFYNSFLSVAHLVLPAFGFLYTTGGLGMTSQVYFKDSFMQYFYSIASAFFLLTTWIAHRLAVGIIMQTITAIGTFVLAHLFIQYFAFKSSVAIYTVASLMQKTKKAYL